MLSTGIQMQSRLSSPTRCSRLRGCEIRATVSEEKRTVLPGEVVLVAGAAGGVGQLTVDRLLKRGYKVRAAVREAAKAEAIFEQHPNLEIAECDLRHESDVRDLVHGVKAVCSCLGTTAFPSKRWRNNNTPEQTDGLAVPTLIDHTPSDIGRFVLISSVGVTRTNQMPFNILNAFKVLTYKRLAELKLMSSDLPWTIIRPCRLTDAPYTSTDLNSLIRGTKGDRLSLLISREDNLNGEASRIDVAESIVQCLHLPETVNACYALANVKGENSPKADPMKWEQLFASC